MSTPETTAKWTVFAMTEDHRSLIRALREVNENLADHALNHSTPLHDDDPDGIVNTYIEINTLRELRMALNALACAPHIIATCVYATVENNAGISTEARCGPWWFDAPDDTGGKVHVRQKARTSRQEQAMTEAIALLKGAMQ